MKGRLVQAMTSTIRRGARPPWYARWNSWFERQPPIPQALFQGQDDPYPRHWRRAPAYAPDPATMRRRLAAAVERLPVTWQRVLTARDIRGDDAAQTASENGLSPLQEQRVLNRARAQLWAAVEKTETGTTAGEGIDPAGASR